MKQLIAILLLLVYTCTGAVLEQFQKAPLLYVHYQEHQALDQGISASEFVVIHYLSGNVKDADYDRDMQLPFKTTDFFSAATAQVVVPPLFTELNFTIHLLPSAYVVVKNESFIPSQYLSSIWQPPRAC